MGPDHKTGGSQPAAGGALVSHSGDRYAPRRLTFAENVKLTIKVFAGAGVVIAVALGTHCMDLRQLTGGTESRTPGARVPLSGPVVPAVGFGR